MNWVLIANTAVSKIDYNMLVWVFVFILFFVIGFRLADIRIKQRRKRKETDS